MNINDNDKEKAKQVYKEGVNRYKVKRLALSVLFALEKIAIKKGDEAAVEIIQQRITEVIGKEVK